MDNTHLFSTRGSSYELARPGYPEALIDYLYGELHFAQADAIREELAAKGILIEDTREGTKWKKA